MTAEPLGVGTAARSRIDWLDAAKGIGILLVVFGHALGGLIDSPMGAGLDRYRQVFFLIYTFHMPLFFLLSALLVAPRLEADRAGFTRTLFTRIAWPYFLWSAIQAGVIVGLGGLTNQQGGEWLPTVLQLPWKTVSQFWFLHALFLLHVTALILFRPLGPVAYLLFGLSLAALPHLVPLPEVLRLAAGQGVFYGLGVALGTAGVAQAFIERPRWAKLGLLVLAAVLAVVALHAAPRYLPELPLLTAKAAGIARLAWQPEVLPAAIAGTGAAIGLGSLATGPLGRLLAFLGQRSMAIFILHVMGVAGTRIILSSVFGIREPAVILPLSFAVGLVGPLVFYELARRAKLNRILGLG
jgi:fucose 4-O-acetylase-like acetyltransferase